nr:hypothetical protein [Tanacetum cinerariifolium]
MPKEVSNFAPPMIKSMVTESLKHKVLAKESSQPKSTYKATASLTKFELKKILIDKLDESQSYLTATEYGECYNGLIKSYDLDKSLLSTYDKVYSLKRSQKDKDKDEDPSVGLDRRLKKRKTTRMLNQQKEPEFKIADSEMPQDQEENLGNDDEEPKRKNRLTNLSGNDVSDFAIALRMFTRSMVIEKRVENFQLGVKSYQKKINVTETETTRPGIQKRDPYTSYQDPQGFIYVDNQWRNRDFPLVSVEVHRYDIKKSKSKNKGKVLTEMELVLEQTQQEHQSDTKVFTMTIAILLEPTSNKLMWLETASGILVMPSEHQSDDVKKFVTTSERNQLKEALEDSAKRRRPCNSLHTTLPVRCLDGILHRRRIRIFSLTSMENKNPIRTHGDYSRPSHEGYRNTIKLPDGNNVLREKNAKESWEIIENLTLYEHEGWDDPRDFAKLVKQVGRQKKELVRGEVRHPVAKNVNAISIVKMLKEKNTKNNKVVKKNVIQPSELNVLEPEKVVDVKEAVENGTDHEENMSMKEKIAGEEIEELVEMARSQPIGYYLKHKINKELINGLIGNQRYNDSLLATRLGIAEDVLVEIAGYVYPVAFVILDVKEDNKKPFILGTPFLTIAKADEIRFDKGIITLKSGKNKINLFKFSKSPRRFEVEIKNDIDLVAPTSTVSRLILEWEERIKLYQEKKMKFNQLRSKVFNDRRSILVKEEGEVIFDEEKPRSS